MARLHRLRRQVVAAVISMGLAFAAPGEVVAEEFSSPDILILGDSQLSFGSGPAFLEFFTDIEKHCGPEPQQLEKLRKLGKMKVGVIGVRATSIHSWTARSGPAKGAVCDVDPNWNVNAGAYGYLNTTNNEFVQIGKGKEYQFCHDDKSPFEAMFRQNYYKPKLLLMSFLGNSASRWAQHKDLAVKDVKAMMEQVPQDMACIFMTTAPAFSKKIVDLRLLAQENLKQAFIETGNRCTFIPGATPQTVAANQGNKHYFRLDESGMVKDPYHPNDKAAENFFALEMDGICGAIFEQLDRSAAPSL